MKYLLCLLALSCAPNPERDAKIIRTAIDAGRLGCLTAAAKGVELTDEQRAQCLAVLRGCPK